ncbi:hypothetical protein XENORESO_002643 [Xenotaenia resolanae]|uniref:Uncharacterized protein n=1 Tax=Xenotaenia resolanae TaxID=208358 RepID=A0ABV0W0M3_9TELE
MQKIQKITFMIDYEINILPNCKETSFFLKIKMALKEIKCTFKTDGHEAFLHIFILSHTTHTPGCLLLKGSILVSSDQNVQFQLPSIVTPFVLEGKQNVFLVGMKIDAPPCCCILPPLPSCSRNIWVLLRPSGQ